jgi:hypothetical protein
VVERDYLSCGARRHGFVILGERIVFDYFLRA